MNKMYKLRDMLCDELDNIVEQDEITTGTLEIIDKLTHSIKSIDTIVAMQEADYSNEYHYNDRGYDDGMSRRGSYARRKRDSRGRYSRGYSRMENKDMTDKLEDMMEETSDPAVKQALQKAIHHIGE